jgi:hypothetical protein
MTGSVRVGCRLTSDLLEEQWFGMDEGEGVDSEDGGQDAGDLCRARWA